MKDTRNPKLIIYKKTDIYVIFGKNLNKKREKECFYYISDSYVIFNQYGTKLYDEEMLNQRFETTYK